SGATTPVLRVELEEAPQQSQAAAISGPPRREGTKETMGATGASVAASGPVRYKRRKRHRRRHSSSKKDLLWQAILAGVLVVVLLLLAITLAQSADHWFPRLTTHDVGPKEAAPEGGP